MMGGIDHRFRIILWGAATFWLTGHALFHLWEVASGMSEHSAIGRDFPAVTLPAIAGIGLTTWAIRAGRYRPANSIEE